MTTRIEEEFTIMKKIGEGTFGQVYLVKSHQSGLLYAMKKVRIGNYENGNRRCETIYAKSNASPTNESAVFE